MKKTVFLWALWIGLLPLVASGQVDALGGYASAIEVRRAHVTGRVFDLERQPELSAISVGGRYIGREIDQEVDRDTDGLGIRGGVAWWGENVLLGVSLDHEDLTSDFRIDNPNRDRGEVVSRSYTLALLGQIEWEEWTLAVEGGYGHSEYDARRQTVTGTKVANFDGDDLFALARLDRAFSAADDWVVRPFVAVSGSRVNLDTFRESPAPDARRVLGDRYSEVLGFGGVTFERAMRTARPSLSLAWVQRLGSSDFTLRRTARDDPAHQEREAEKLRAPYSGLFAVDIAVPVNLGENWLLTPGARFIAGSDDTRWSIGADVSFAF